VQAFRTSARQVTPGDQALAELLNRTRRKSLTRSFAPEPNTIRAANINSVERTEAGNWPPLTGEPGGVYAVEASTNLVDWEIGR